MPVLEKEIAKKLLEEENIKVFVETGTCKGETIFSMEELFDKLYTVELGKKFYDDLVDNYKGLKINFYNGRSQDKLPVILKNIDEKVLFFLDAHYSGGDTYGSVYEVPLLDELKIIMDWGKECVVIIDDCRIFGTYWLSVKDEQIDEVVKDRVVKKYYLPSELDQNDRMVLFIKGDGDIPPSL